MIGALATAWLATLLVGCTLIAPSPAGSSVTPPTSAPLTATQTAQSPSPIAPSLSNTARSAVSRPTTTTPAPSQLIAYVLGLINSDRAQYGLDPVVLGTNPAAQIHAQDMFDNYFLSHWGTDGMKPYMRYTVGGGTNYEDENSAYSGWYDRSTDPNRYNKIDPMQEAKQLEYNMMYDDAGSNWGHRDNILNKRHKKVNIGIAYDVHRLTMVEEFEGDYMDFVGVPALTNGTLTMSGSISLGTVDSVDIFYDPLPQPMTQDQLLSGPRSYSLGTRVATIVPPPPPGYYYTQLPPNAVQATFWTADDTGQFSNQADIKAIIDQQGAGVYTVVVWTKTGADTVMLTNYSLWVR